MARIPKVCEVVRYLGGDFDVKRHRNLTEGHAYEVTGFDPDHNAAEIRDNENDVWMIGEWNAEHYELVMEGTDVMPEETRTAPYRAEQRQARKGERIVIVEPCVHDSEDYERGDVFTVDKVDSAGVVTTTGNIVYHEEYEVLPEEMADGAEKRYAKPGERIVITSPYDDQIACGEEYTVKTTEDDVVITAEDGKAIAHEEYEVLPDGMAIDGEVADSAAMLSEAIREIVDDSDNVHSPQHYRQGGVEVIDIIRDAVRDADGFEAVCHANVIKYVLRYRYKNGVEDVKKAAVYLDWLIAELERRDGA